MRKLGIIGKSDNIDLRVKELGINGRDFPKGIILESPDTTKELAKQIAAVPFLSADLLVDYADALIILNNTKENLRTAIDFIKANKLVHFDSIAFPFSESIHKLLKVVQEGNDLISLNNHKWSEEVIEESRKHFSSPLLGKFKLHIGRDQIIAPQLHEELVDVLEFILSIYKGGVKKVRSCGINSGDNKELLHIHLETHNGSLIFIELVSSEFLYMEGEISEPGTSANIYIEDDRAEFTVKDSTTVHNNIGQIRTKHFTSSLKKQSFHYIGLEDIYQLNFVANEIIESFHNL